MSPAVVQADIALAIGAGYFTWAVVYLTWDIVQGARKIARKGRHARRA